MKSIIKTIRFPENILEEIRPIINKNNSNFTEFVIKAIKTYIRILNYTDGINKSFGAWEKSNHQELKEGTIKYVTKIRKGRTI